MTCYKKNIKYPEYAQIDLSACHENILLEADHLGLGAVWLGIAPLQERMEAVREVLKIPEEMNAFSIIALGYPAESKQQEDRFDSQKILYID